MRNKLILIILAAITLFVLSIFLLGFYNEYIIQNNNSSVNVNMQKNDNKTKTIKAQAIIQTDSGLNDTFSGVHQNNYESKDRKWVAIERKDNYNGELQYYSQQNVEFGNNGILIYSRKENKQDKKYTSGQVETKSAYLYGDFEFNIKINAGKGLFPAIWLLSLQGTEFPEIDIFEMIGSEPLNFYGVVHYKQKSALKKDFFCCHVKPSQVYNIRFVWAKDKLEWYIDGKCVYSTKKYVPQEYMYLIANQAVGGIWPGDPDENAVFPAQFEIVSYSINPEKEVER